MAATTFREFERLGWEDASVCAQYDATLAAVTAQSTGSLLDAAAVRAGSRVLDVGTGAGHVAAEAAQRGAEAIGVDFSAAQIGLARARHAQVRYETADAEALPFGEASFDAVVCAFGLCHFPEPGVALAEMCRVLRPGGRVAFTVWAAPAHTLALGAMYGAIREHGTLEVGLPAGPNFFLFSDAGASAAALDAAGFAAPEFRLVGQSWWLRDVNDAFQALSRGTVRAAATLRAQSDAARKAIRESMRAKLEACQTGDGFEVPMPAALSCARKPPIDELLRAR